MTDTTSTDQGAAAAEPVVADGFGPVADAFAAAVKASRRGGAALSVLVDGRRVVNLWGGFTEPKRRVPWQGNTPTVMFSCSKGVISAAVARLVEQGRIDLDAPVAQYWPEFAAGGKEGITVRVLMSHRGGLSYPTRDLTRQDVLAWDPVAAALAAQEPLWEPGSGWSYHAVTWGWLVGEVIRRVTGLPGGQAFDELVAGPIGADVWFGDQPGRPSELPPVAPIKGYEVLLALVPNAKKIARTITLGGALPVTLVDAHGGGLNDPEIRAAEVLGAGGVGTAAGLAEVWSSTVVATEGTQPIDPAVREDMTRPLTSGEPAVGIAGTPHPRWGTGFMIDSPGRPLLSPRSFGHDGAGGQLGIADPDLGVGLGFLTSDMQADDGRVLGILEALRRCL